MMDSALPREGVNRSFHPLTCAYFREKPLPRFFNFSWTSQGKILGHWKDRLNISKLAQFVSDTSQANEDIVLQSGKNLQTFLWWGWGGGQVCAPPPHHTNVSKIWCLLRSYVFVCCQQITFKRDNFTKRALSSRVDGFSLTYPQKSWKEKKKREEVYLNCLVR